MDPPGHVELGVQLVLEEPLEDSINTSVRDKKNILEVKLEKQEGTRFTLTQEETENLLTRLDIQSSKLVGDLFVQRADQLF